MPTFVLRGARLGVLMGPLVSPKEAIEAIEAIEVDSSVPTLRRPSRQAQA